MDNDNVINNGTTEELFETEPGAGDNSVVNLSTRGQKESFLGGVTESREGARKLEIAQKTGIFYGKMIDLCLTDEPVGQRNAKVNEALSELPDEVRSRYATGVKVFQGELTRNSDRMRRELAPPDASNIIRRILRYTLEDQGYDASERSAFVRAVKDKITLEEPLEGLPILRIDEGVRDIFLEYGVMKEDVAAICFRGDDTIPTYILATNKEEYYDADKETSRKQAVVRHETHHFIWKMLTDGGFVAPTTEVGPLTRPFEDFRDELAGRIISGEAFAQEGMETEMMIHSKAEEAKEAAKDVTELSYLCLRIAQERNIDPSSYLYPILTARTFDEMKKNIIEITPLDRPISEDDLYNIFINSKFRAYSTGNALSQLLNSKGVHPDEIDQGTIDTFFTRVVNEGEVHGGHREMLSILKFFKASGINFPRHLFIEENLYLIDE